MGIRPGRCYHHFKGKPYTRQSKRRPRKSYVKGVPVPQIHQFEMGDPRKAKDYPVVYHLICTQDRQMRSNSLEAARISVTKYVTKHVGEGNFFIKVRVYPHHVIRENPLATGAGADRFSQGMARAFGKPIGQAARVKAGQKVISVYAIKGKDKEVKTGLKRASMKLPGFSKIVEK